MNPFDGPKGVLGHAFYPSNGATHFDDAERWSLSGYYGTNFFQVALHELGHALGLAHSKDQNAVMAATYRGYIADYRLQQDDINGIQGIYGRKSRSSGPQVDLCADSKPDAIFADADNRTYLFKGSYYYRIEKNQPMPSEYPKKISLGWQGLECKFWTFGNR